MHACSSGAQPCKHRRRAGLPADTVWAVAAVSNAKKAPPHLRMLVRVPKLRETRQTKTTSSSGAIVCKAPAMSAAARGATCVHPRSRRGARRLVEDQQLDHSASGRAAGG